MNKNQKSDPRSKVILSTGAKMKSVIFKTGLIQNDRAIQKEYIGVGQRQSKRLQRELKDRVKQQQRVKGQQGVKQQQNELHNNKVLQDRVKQQS